MTETLEERVAQILTAVDLGTTDDEWATVARRIIAMCREVKPLEWHESHMSSWNGDFHTVPTAYTVRCADENGWEWSDMRGAFGYASSPVAAKAAAEARHRERVWGMLK